MAVPHVVLNNVRMVATDVSGEFIAAKVNITVGKDVTIEHLLKRTDGMIRSSCPQGFVDTRAFTEATKMLEQHSMCVVTGRPGQGKTTLGLELLRHFKESQSYRPCIILSPAEVASVPYPQDWDNVQLDERYVLLLDDMLGSSNLLPSLLDQWSESMLPALWPKVDSGQVKVIATFRPHIYKMAATRLKKTQVFQDEQLLDLHDHQVQLTSQERMSIFQKFASQCGRHVSQDRGNDEVNARGSGLQKE